MYIEKTIPSTLIYQNGDELIMKIGNTNFATCYWSPNENTEAGINDLETAIAITKKNDSWVITGDLNVGLEPVVDQAHLPYRKKNALKPLKYLLKPAI